MMTEQRRQELIEHCKRIMGESSPDGLEYPIAETALASLTAVKSPMMFIDGDISPESADKLAKVIQEFNKSDDGPMENIPAIPDGYVVVPIKPTEEMIIAGFESEPDEDFSDSWVWESYEKMSGCQQAAFKATLCWNAMIDAATSK